MVRCIVGGYFFVSKGRPGVGQGSEDSAESDRESSYWKFIKTATKTKIDGKGQFYKKIGRILQDLCVERAISQNDSESQTGISLYYTKSLLDLRARMCYTTRALGETWRFFGG